MTDRRATSHGDTTVDDDRRADPREAGPDSDPQGSVAFSALTKDDSTEAAPATEADGGVPGGGLTGSAVASAGGPVGGGSTGRMRLGDRVFLALTTGASGFVILAVVLVGVFLLVQAIPSIVDDKSNFLFSTDWDTTPGALHFGVAALLYTTVLISLLALLIAVPLAIGIALFITQYAPRRLSRPVAHVIDLLAAIPSVIYGVWGIRVFAPHLTGIQTALSHIGLGIFNDQNILTGTVFNGGVVLAIMILPIITAISRDVFDRTPSANKEAALALGATRWEMIRMAVLPYGRAGVVSGSMLGLGRALGETVAVYLILSTVSTFSPSMFSGGSTIASKIALGQAEFGAHPGPFIAAGLVLFVLTFVVNAAARAIVNRGVAAQEGRSRRQLPGSSRIAQLVAPAFMAVGLIGILLGLTAFDWFSGGPFARHLLDVHTALDATTAQTYGISSSYFAWLGWVVLGVAIAGVILAFRPGVTRGKLRTAGLIVGVGGIGVTYWAVHLGPALDGAQHVGPAFWFTVIGLAFVWSGMNRSAAHRPTGASRQLGGRFRRKWTNSVASVAMSAAFVVALLPLIWLLYTVISKGYHVIIHGSWWTSSQRNINYSDPGGGALHAIIGTLEQVALCSVIAVPIALLVGVYLVEYGRGRFARVTTFMVDILTGIPSIVAALFIFALIVTTFGGNTAAWLVSLALVLLMVPVVVRATEEMLKLVPNELREAALALGVPKWKVIVSVVIPTAFSGLITGVVLGIARVAGETAPLLILVGYAKSTNANLFNGPQGSLPGMINEQFFNLNHATGAGAYHLDANGNRVLGASANYAPDRMWGTALTLILIVLLLNVIARLVGRFNKVAK